MTQQAETPQQMLRRVLAVWRCLAIAEKVDEAELLASKPDSTTSETAQGSCPTHQPQYEVTKSTTPAFKE